jgi:MFS family permease
MQSVLRYSPIKTGAAYLPLCLGVGIAAGITSKLIPKVGTRPLIVAGAVCASGGLYWLSRIPLDGSYLTDLLPGLMIVSFGLGAVFVGVTTAANAGVPADRAGLAAALLNACQQVGSALGLAIFSAAATARTNHLLATHTAEPDALTAGFHRALLTGSVFLLGAAVIGLATYNAHSEDSELPATTAPALQNSDRTARGGSHIR